VGPKENFAQKVKPQCEGNLNMWGKEKKKKKKKKKA